MSGPYKISHLCEHVIPVVLRRQGLQHPLHPLMTTQQQVCETKRGAEQDTSLVHILLRAQDERAIPAKVTEHWCGTKNFFETFEGLLVAGTTSESERNSEELERSSMASKSNDSLNCCRGSMYTEDPFGMFESSAKCVGTCRGLMDQLRLPRLRNRVTFSAGEDPPPPFLSGGQIWLEPVTGLGLYRAPDLGGPFQ
uniref:Uncharacterized protein n=1 Tax=Chromera velia CCMP2878 TaxID=1169474 RepID=A0A0G4IB78_9ALVE|eukprot:Cvel_12764.t1-p1 / transcript=Cvel_12764.t1 / gene=Cvel_12764 / organism=Chromera_velia_CCMP2878 / gene_product=hypothetical protein / transcript_product=hypothetical protein / location=Cvel_scaffold849:25284-28883(-) / protein_length=195 / sequence_SO=supercontig / SO=protein_coding / is_pseudo=false